MGLEEEDHRIDCIEIFSQRELNGSSTRLASLTMFIFLASNCVVDKQPRMAVTLLSKVTKLLLSPKVFACFIFSLEVENSVGCR